MANSKQVITSLLTEHFKYAPLTLVDDIIDMVNDIMYRAVAAIEEGLNSATPETLGFADRASAEGRVPDTDDKGDALYPEARTEIENGVHQLETLLESTVDKNFDKLEIYVLRNILTVPEDIAPWIRLKHYDNLDFSTKGDEPTPESLFILRRKYQETQRLHNSLLAESSRNKQLIQQLRSLLHPQALDDPEISRPSGNLSFLTRPAMPTHTETDSKMETPQPVTSQTELVTSQLPELRTLLATLKAKAEAIKAPRRVTEPEAERREYIETQARKGLERGGVVDVQTGDGLGGKGGPGPSVGSDEVKSIENVASILGKKDVEDDKMEE